MTDEENSQDIVKMRDEALRYRALVDSMNDGFGIIDMGNEFVYVNNKFAEMLEYTPDEMIGEEVTTFLDDENIEVMKKNIQMRQEGMSTQYEIEWLKKSGRSIPTIVSGAPLIDDSGTHIGSFAVITDITLRKRAERAIKESEEKFRLIFEESPIGIELFDKDGILIDANDSALEIGGLSDLEDLIGFNLMEDPNIPEQYKEILVEGEQVRYEVEFDFGKVHDSELYRTTKKGIIFLDAQIKPLRKEEGGEIVGYMSQLVDITPRKVAQKELEDSEQRYRTLVETGFQGILIHEEGIILDANDALANMFRYDIDELLGQSMFKFLTPESVEIVREHVTKGYEEPYEFVGVRKDGTKIFLEGIAKGCTYKGRNARIAAVRDITHRKQSEIALKRSEDLFRKTIESTADGIIIISNSGEILYHNSNFEELWDVPSDLLAESDEGTLVMYVMDKVTRPKILEQKIRELKVSKADDRGLLRFKDDKVLEYFTCRIELANEQNGRLWSFKDVTAQKKAEKLTESLRDLGMQLSTITEHDEAIEILLDTAIDITDMDAGALYLVDKQTLDAEMIFQRGLKKSTAEKISTFRHGEHQNNLILEGVPVYRDPQNETLHKDIPEVISNMQTFGLIPLKHEGLIIAALLVFSSTKNEISRHAKDTVAGIASQLAGMIARVEAEQSLMERESQLRGILSSLHETMVILYNQDGQFIKVWSSRDLDKRYGIDSSVLVGKNIDEIVASEESKLVKKAIHYVIETGNSTQERIFVNYPNGGFWHDISFSPMWGEHGHVSSVVAFSRDITDLKRAEWEIRAAKDRSGLYLDLLAHDIRNQLQVILGSSTLLHERSKDITTVRLLEHIVKAAEKCASLISKVKSTENLLQAPLRRRSIKKALKKCIEMVSSLYSDLVIHTSLDSDDAKIDADEFLEHLFHSLLENAYEHNPRKTKEVWVALEEADDGYIITVADNGIGLSERVRENLFNMERRFGGVSLHQCKQIVDKYGGEIEVQDRIIGHPSRGLLFRIFLPKRVTESHKSSSWFEPT